MTARFSLSARTFVATSFLLASHALHADHIQSFQSAETVLGSQQFNAAFFLITPTQSSMLGPQSVAIDPVSGKLFVADAANNRVLRFSSAATLTTGAAAEAVFGQPDFTSKGFATTPKEMSGPTGVACDSTGTLWVADSNNNRILRFDNAAAKPMFSASADAVLGQANLSSKVKLVPPTAASVNDPFGVAVDSTGTVWVADTANNRVLRFDHAAIKANGANADGVIGSPTFTDNAGGLTNRYALSFPICLAADGSGTLWVGDAFNSRVLRFDHAATLPNGPLADGLLGQFDYVSKIPYSPPTAATLTFVSGMVVDAEGALWVSDTSSNRVLRFDDAAHKTDSAPADAVLGQKSFITNYSATTRAGLRSPGGLALDAAGNLFVADSSNERILRFTPKPDPAITTPAPSPSAAPPTLSIAGKRNIRTSKSSILVKGSAASSEGISRVEFRIGKGAFRAASGTSAWKFTASLKPGKNTLTIRAVSNGQLTAQAILHATRD
jgi:sugar lactone lactonase YvrE